MLERINPLLLALLIAAVVTIIVLVVSPYSGQPQWQPQGGENTNHSQNVANPTAITHSSIQIECDPNCTADESKKHTNENAIARLIRKTLDDPLALSTAILALATMVLAIYTAVVARATRTAARHIPTVERAWVFVEPREFEVRGTGEFDFKVGLKNHGKTPAFAKVVWAKVCMSEPGSPNPVYEGEEPDQINVVISAGDIFPYPKSFKGSITEHYFYGYTRYTDIFGDIQVTRFCVLLNPYERRFEIAGHPAWNAYYTEKPS